MNSQRICVFSTRLGWFGVVWRGQALAAVTFGHRRREQVQLALKRLDPGTEPSVFVEEDREPLAIRLMDEPEGPVIVAADADIEVGDVVRILDLAKQNGADKVSLLKGGPGGGGS